MKIQKHTSVVSLYVWWRNSGFGISSPPLQVCHLTSVGYQVQNPDIFSSILKIHLELTEACQGPGDIGYCMRSRTGVL